MARCKPIEVTQEPEAGLRVALITMIEPCRDDPSRPRAILPIANITLGELQMDMLVRLGAEKILCSVDAVPGHILRLADQYTAQGVAFEWVRTPAELALLIAPGDDILLIADGLYVDARLATGFFTESGKAIATLHGLEGDTPFERIDINHHWAGMARVRGSDITEVAQVPDDWNVQSAVLRCAVQKNYPRVTVPLRKVQNGRLHFITDDTDSAAQTRVILHNSGSDMPLALSRKALQPLADRLAPYGWRSGWTAPVLRGVQALAFINAPVLAWNGWTTAALALLCLGALLGYFRATCYPFAKPDRLETLANGVYVAAGVLTLFFALWQNGEPITTVQSLYTGLMFVALYLVYALKFAGHKNLWLQAACDIILILLVMILASYFSILLAIFMMLSAIYALAILRHELRETGMVESRTPPQSG